LDHTLYKCFHSNVPWYQYLPKFKGERMDLFFLNCNFNRAAQWASIVIWRNCFCFYYICLLAKTKSSSRRFFNTSHGSVMHFKLLPGKSFSCSVHMYTLYVHIYLLKLKLLSVRNIISSGLTTLLLRKQLKLRYAMCRFTCNLVFVYAMNGCK